ncbi:PAS domain-containing sensor histidine kinase [Pyxidicoccus sp. MSG2]|uniref:PAS domain-containing sensor histidine kinase n=1 Tax=Pyxidicoccus sp. MSG2 TaxID=2996790 RepID=UPI0022709FF4|nr:ATP-binding protein [Pyxidicoccus sp. MSG2]MCY1017168.1 ATP-binding protein [Pyxidicoccus sp. MSG2]
MAEARGVEAVFGPLIDGASESIIVRDPSGHVLLWNKASEALYGHARDAMLGRHLHDSLNAHPPSTIARIEQSLLEQGHWEGELKRTTASGEEKRVEVRWTVQRGPDGQPAFILEYGRDLTRLSDLEAESRVQAHRYRNLFQAMAASFWELDFSEVREMLRQRIHEGVADFRAYFAAHPEFIDAAIAVTRVVDVNDKTAMLFGAGSREALIGGTVAPFWPPESRHVYAESLLASVDRLPSLSRETRLSALDGRMIDALFTVCWPSGHHGRGTVLVGVIDLSDRVAAEREVRRLQSEFAHASRLSMLGELTASIAHEVNQPLAAIVTNGAAGARWLSRPQPDLDEVRAIHANMVSDARRAADIIARIRAMASNKAVERQRLSPNQVIEEAVLFLRHELMAHEVDLRLVLSSGLPDIEADRVQLQQTVVNLALNAMQEMRRAGCPRPRLDLMTLASSGELRFAIEDTGPGIPPEHQDRLFQSFFTTKASGLGMGLSICRNIIEAHGGRIWGENIPDGGARFVFTLPFAR